jgi:hypothetical protein
MNTDVIARTRFEYCVAGRPAQDIEIEIFRPSQAATGEWACHAAIRGLHPELATMRGEDALQALTLALNLVHQLLEGAVSRGARLRFPGTSDDVPLDAYFPAAAVPDDDPES